ncbi:MAG: cadmium-translocating P-type ATPase [Oscillospiraceae bacterium]|nr:cadmium-translocating P-type ATPase [Oscillospiraceae bacterium]
MNKKQKKVLRRIVLSVLLLGLIYALFTLHVLPENRWLELGLYLIPYLVIGYDILLKAAKGLRNAQPFDENFLMAVATVGAIALGEYLEGAAVMLFYQIGELFQSYAVGKSRRSISALMDIRPDTANVAREDGTLEQVDPDEVPVGTVIWVQPGEKIPIDGVVVEGQSTLDTAALTGESVPRDVWEGEEVVSGCVNLNGLLKVRTTREFGESTASKILDLVENASSKKSRQENFISRFARVYTPVVCLGALLLALLPPLANLLLGRGSDWSTWIYRALTFLVISCPCALVISIPLSFFAGIGGASGAGVLVKGSKYMETLSRVRLLAFDKTGTMTQGVFEVQGVHHSAMEERELLELATLAESYSTHPISRSLQRAWGGVPDKSRVGELREIPGQGVVAQVDGKSVAVGNDKLMAALGVEAIACRSAGTVVHVAVDGAYAGHILITDMLKPTAREAVAALKSAGVERAVMLTGDSRSAAEETARALGGVEYFAGLLPADKVAKVEELLARKPKGAALAFVGDGINDAPVLSRADLGIAMGALGSDAAIEAADVVLMDDNPLKVAKAIRIAKKCLRIVYENIVFAIGVKLLCLLLGALGLANMWAAIFADVGVMVIAVLNAIRALRVKNL